MDELIGKTAREVVALLKAGDISVGDTLAALESRIAEVDGEINALPTLCFERARQSADRSDFSTSLLAGIPVAIKDLEDVAGVRSTYGSKVFENHVPETSDLLVETLEANGAVVYAKSNTPEFGSGGNTFNDVFGATRNPYDPTRSVAGSSGGAAAALASGCAWLAQGSDLGGSLRTPAGFCGVTSLRPSPGLIAAQPGLQPFEVYAQKGPMARDIADLALFADAMSGVDTRAALCKPRLETSFRAAAGQAVKPPKVACSADLGVSRCDDDLVAVFDAAMHRLEAEDLRLEYTQPDLTMADTAFDVSRGLSYALSYGPDLQQIRGLIKPENVWNIEKGLSLSNGEILDGMRAAGQIFANASNFMQDYDLLICPASIHTPFVLEERYPGYSDGLAYSEYYRWLRIAYAITLTSLPVITIPCGKSDAGLPVGLQLIGKPHGELELFAYASYLEQIFAWDPLQNIAG